MDGPEAGREISLPPSLLALFHRLSMLTVVPRRAPPVQASDRAVQSAHAEADRRLSRGRHDPREKDDRDHQSEIQQPQHQVLDFLDFATLLVLFIYLFIFLINEYRIYHCNIDLDDSVWNFSFLFVGIEIGNCTETFEIRIGHGGEHGCILLNPS